MAGKGTQHINVWLPGLNEEHTVWTPGLGRSVNLCGRSLEVEKKTSLISSKIEHVTEFGADAKEMMFSFLYFMSTFCPVLQHKLTVKLHLNQPASQHFGWQTRLQPGRMSRCHCFGQIRDNNILAYQLNRRSRFRIQLNLAQKQKEICVWWVISLL